MKITVELPEPPDGYEVFHSFQSVVCDGILERNHWACGQGANAFRSDGFLLRRKQPLADWANAHPAFRSLAEILNKGRLSFNGLEWILSKGSSVYGTKLPPPPNGLTRNALELYNGKWTDAP